MDKINKNLLKIPDKQRARVLAAAKQIRQGNFESLDLKKIKGSKDLFRVRVGRYRIVIQSKAGQKPVIIDVSKRDDQTYKDF